MTGRRAVLATVFDAVESETPYGGRSVTYEPLGVVWVKLGAVRRRTRAEGGVGRTIDHVSAEGRADARLIPGRVLRLGGADWRVTTSETVGGRSLLIMERTR